MRRSFVVLFVALGLLGVVPFTAGTDQRAAAAPNQFVTMPDGIRIAVNVRLPDTFVAGRRYPTVFEMSGYDGGSASGGTLVKDLGLPAGLPLLARDDSRQLSRMFNHDYVTIHASLRGTGCSGGQFDLFSLQSAEDGKYVIDQWIARQPWSNGDVALLGHSYSGITGFLIAATRPTHLRVATLSGLIDDLYRGITYPGGITNYGFPLLWTGAYRMFNDLAGGLAPGLVRPQRPGDVPNRQAICAENTLTKSRTVLDDPLLQGLVDTDDEWYRARSLITYAKQIDVPVHITGAFQDEQTGPRGPTHLWEQLEGIPKRLLITNGNHDTQNPSATGPAVWADRKAWVDHWMGLTPRPDLYGVLAERRTSVTTLFELHRDAHGGLVPNERLTTRTFPLETTRWTDWYLSAGNRLATTPPGGSQPADTYLSGTHRQSWAYQIGPTFGAPFTTSDGPDQVSYRSAPLAAPVAIDGPVTATLFVQSSAPDTELFVQLVDEGADGSRTFLQRGMLNASHRAIDPTKSDWADGRIYRPWRPHTNPTAIVPGQTYEYLVEVFPIGHIFRPGHRIRFTVTAPPLADSLYVYLPKTLPGVNTVLHDAGHPSRLTLPVVPLTGTTLGPALPCGAQEAVRCVKP